MSDRRQKGFTLLELIVAVTVIAILTVAAIPNFRSWIGNSKVRSVADGIEQGLRLAAAEAARDSRRVDFSLTNSVFAPGTAGSTVVGTAVANGRNWAVTTEPLTYDSTNTLESSVYVAGANLGSVTDGVSITGPATTTFNSVGSVIGAAVGTLVTYTVNTTTATHKLNVTVSASGQIRVCDPSRLISSSPDGC